MKRYLLLLTTLFTVHISSYAKDYRKEIDSALTTFSKQGKFNGSALVTQYGSMILEKGYGYKDLKQKTLNDSNTIYQIGSVTKTFTSTMILMLQKQGKLNVKDKLSKYYPDFPEGNDITLENLLTHTSGIFNYTDDSAFMAKEPFKHHSKAEMMQYFKDHAIQFAPGSKFGYSNSNYSILGYIIEDVTGKSYFSALREMILTPLGMKHTGCDFAGLKDKNKATGYYAIDGNRGMIAPKVDSSVSFAAGGIYTTVGDLNKWAVAMLHNQLITKADWQIATTINQENYGYGWMIGDNYGRVSIGHNGGVHGFIANLFMTPDDASVIVLLSNDMGNDLSAIRRTISAIINDKEYQLPVGHREIKMATNQLQEYAGNYELAPGFVMKVFMDGNSLMGQLPGQNAFQLYPAAPNEFFLKVTDAELRFLRDKNNKVERVLLKQNGRAIPGVRK